MKQKKIRSYPLVSIIIPSYNSESMIESCLTNILKTEYGDFEIILVDDCSTDSSLSIAKKIQKKDKRLVIIQNKINSGPSKTRNNGLRHANGELIAFLETDMEIEKQWLDYLVKKLISNPELGAVQSKVCDIQHRDKIQGVGILYVPQTFWVLGIGIGQDEKLFNESRYVGIGAVGSVVWKKVLDKIGYFDEQLIHNIDDIDLGFRVWLAGYKIQSVPESITYHWTFKPPAIRQKTTSLLRSEFYSQKVPRVFLKNYELMNAIRYIIVYYAIYLLRGILKLFEGNIYPLKGLLYATVWNIKVLPDTLKERKRIQKLRRFTDKEIFNYIGIPGNLISVHNKFIAPLRSFKEW